jgi:ATP-binding cassette subfamily F protein 3
MNPAAEPGQPGAATQAAAAMAAEPDRKPHEERTRKKKEEKRQEAEERNRIFRATSALKRDLAATEDRIALLEAKKKEAEGVLCEPDIYRDPDRIRQLNQELTSVSAELEDLYYGWNDLSLRLEAMEDSLRGQTP